MKKIWLVEINNYEAHTRNTYGFSNYHAASRYVNHTIKIDKNSTWEGVQKNVWQTENHSKGMKIYWVRILA